MVGSSLVLPPAHGNSRGRPESKADTRVSTTSNPFLTPAVTSRASSVHESERHALQADPGAEADFQVDNNPFAFSPGQLNKLLNPKSLTAFRALGGLEGIAYGLQSDIHAGLSIDETAAPGHVNFQDAVSATSPQQSKSPWQSSNIGSREAFEDRIRVYNRNILPARKATSLLKLMWNAYNDKVLILLTVAAAISLALGLYETLGVYHPPGSPQPVDYVEGLAILFAIAIVTLVGSVNDWQKERAFVRLSAKKDERDIKVTRSGKPIMISVHDLLVGDVLHLEPGDLVPVDGIFIDGHDLKCDESSATGESDALKKTGGMAVMRALERGESAGELDPFIISGAKVLEGVGTFMCTSVGVNSSFGKIMMSVRTETEPTPLQHKLEGLAMAIAKLGSIAAGLLFFVLLFRFLAGLPTDRRPATDKASSFMDILIVAVTIIVVAVPEGLPLAVTLALAFATTRMLKENNLVRVLRACETMGNATAICSDKTGTLTTNKMTVVAGRFDTRGFESSETSASSALPIASWASEVTPTCKEIITQSIAINSTAFGGEEEGKPIFIGSKTETALLQLARDYLGLTCLAETRANEHVVQIMPFDSAKKCMGAVVKLRSGVHRLLVKGASEILLGHCTSKANACTLEEELLTEADRNSFGDTINQYAARSLRTIGFVFKDYEKWPPLSPDIDKTGHADLGRLLASKNLVFLGVVGIQDPVRPGVPEAVRKAQRAGVTVRMVTGDNSITGKAIASECDIYTDGIVMEGPDFRRLSDTEMDTMLPRLQVLARSSPEDKRVLVARLKALGEIVAVTGDGTNDAPALKAADVGFSMGVSGTEVAKEASSIILMDDNFASIITALKWGRAVNDAVQKFLQFQITVNITAVLLAFVTAVYDAEMKPVLKAVQLLWVNLIMDTFAALALATDPPTEKILDRPPQGKKTALITINMWKMIVGQSIYQLVVTFVLYFSGGTILNYDLTDPDKKLELDTIVFNTFVWMQIFNEFNNRRLDNKFNIFEGVHRNTFFIAINFLMVGLQVAIIFIGSRAFQISPDGLDGTQWAISIVVASLCLPWAILVRLFPDEWFARVVGVLGLPFVSVYSKSAEVYSKVVGVFGGRKRADVEAQSATAPVVVVVDDFVGGGQERKM
ncbi:calcium-translocating P-type ATPase [Colletotrichum karsti]|uniref:Calcium-transporting ATPase n=1 Tax=Colletotrichum karsti TaxID=1095194 RepID=A0A9P6I5J7_9PEZI|nr:calcium-translocating P-type ATPase [Colletotrichum karsti]KAF9876798.1 calcium-translocating P-type ATPase [Colletotrichum karsti]